MHAAEPREPGVFLDPVAFRKECDSRPETSYPRSMRLDTWQRQQSGSADFRHCRTGGSATLIPSVFNVRTLWSLAPPKSIGLASEAALHGCGASPLKFRCGAT